MRSKSALLLCTCLFYSISLSKREARLSRYARSAPTSSLAIRASRFASFIKVCSWGSSFSLSCSSINYFAICYELRWRWWNAYNFSLSMLFSCNVIWYCSCNRKFYFMSCSLSFVLRWRNTSSLYSCSFRVRSVASSSCKFTRVASALYTACCNSVIRWSLSLRCSCKLPCSFSYCPWTIYSCVVSSIKLASLSLHCTFALVNSL